VPLTPEDLAARLGELVVTIDAAACDVADVPLVDYPGGVRPHAEVVLAGAGAVGRGEHVAFDTEAHEALRSLVRRIPFGRRSVHAWSAWASDAPVQARAAIEAAVIDLGLRQQRTTLFTLARTTPRPIRYVVSFGRVPDPVAEAARHPDVELKVDADPAWDDRVYRGLAEVGRVAVVDFKQAGTRADHERAHRALPYALIEDPALAAAPWSASLVARVSFDAPLTDVAALEQLPVHPAAVNLKPARMGGVLPALELAGRCRARAIALYLGGMWEVGVGRRQLHALAAVVTSDGPNDIAPREPRTGRLTVDEARHGFGA